MKIYVVYTQQTGLDYFDLDTARVFLNRKDAEKCRDSYLIGYNSEGYDDAQIYEYEVNE